MKSIETKLNEFLSSSISTDKILKNYQLDEYKIRRQDNKHLLGTLFEKGSMNSIPSFQDSPNRIFIGAYSSIRSGGYMRSNIFIGRHSGVGYRCTLAAGMHNFSGVSINPDTIMARVSNYTDDELNELGISKNRTSVIEMNIKPVVIENDVYLGDGIIVMPGVRIGTGSVVAANAVVTKDVEPYTIVGGITAKTIRDRFPDKIKEQLLETRWWNVKLDILKTLPTDNVFRFLEEFYKLNDDIWDDIPTLGYDDEV
jgi:acetyltransferase-like isoleucine patch superfamily enzyme